MSNHPEHPKVGSIELSVIIPAFNAAPTIAAQIEALTTQEWEGIFEIVVADNGSTDGTIAAVRQAAGNDERVVVVDAGDRPGAAHARNVGVLSARGSLLAFCDADDVVGTGWIAAMGSALRLASFVTGPQEYELLNESWLHGVHGTRTAAALQRFCGIFPFGPTANLGVRREVFDAVGGFDETISVYEDMELCLRAWLGGIQLDFVADALVHYRYRDQMKGLWRQAIAYGAAAPDIARRIVRYGHPAPPRWRGAKNWLWLIRKLPSLRSRAGRARWIVVAGGCVGRVIGSVRARRLML